uniref:BZIP domain-containing protein n=1 Tax=Kalanchoe fedtschenkoi TaxID=63787 RepID=A0A7N0T2B5_KALFE
MGDTERASNDAMQRLQSSFGASSCLNLKQPLASSQQLDVNHMSISHSDAPVRHFAQHFGVESGKRVGMPPSHPGQFPPISPYSQLPAARQPPQALSFQNFGQGSSHSRSLSQPSFINLDSLPPLSPSPYRETSDQFSRDVTMGEKEAGSQNVLASSSFMGVNYGFHAGESLPPRKTHRRSNSDSSAFGFSAMMESSLSLRPLDGSIPAQHNRNFGVANPGLVKSEFLWNADGYKNAEGMGERKSEGEVIDELFSTYMNLDSVETMNSSGNNDKLGNGHHESHHGGDTSDNETEGSINESGNGIATQGVSDAIVKKEGMKRSATQDIAPATRHYRSVSMDSFMGNMNFAQDALKLPPSPSPRPLKLSPSTSLDSNSNTFSLEFGKGEFSGEELKKIMANEKLAEMALVDPKRVKRILANRQSAARSKERKMRYISELEHKVQTLQSETTTLSAQVTQLQRDSAALTSQNNELRFRLQAMEQQAKLRDALNETLHGEVQRLKLTTQQLGLNPRSSKDPANSQMLQIADPKQQENIPIAKEEVTD